MAKIKIKTTREDHAAALKSMCIPGLPSSTCLLAQAIKRVTGRECKVGGKTVRFSDSGEILGLPSPVEDAIIAFDVKKSFTEVEFELEPVLPAKK